MLMMGKMYRTIQMRLSEKEKDNSEHTEVNVIGISSIIEKVHLDNLNVYLDTLICKFFSDLQH